MSIKAFTEDPVPDDLPASATDPDLAKIQDLEEVCLEAEREYLDAKLAAKEKKEVFDINVLKLRVYIRSLKGEEMPLYQPGENGAAEDGEITE